MLADVVRPVPRPVGIDQVLALASAAGVCWCCHADLHGVGGLCLDCRRVVDSLPTVSLLPIDQVLDDVACSCGWRGASDQVDDHPCAFVDDVDGAPVLVDQVLDDVGRC